MLKKILEAMVDPNISFISDLCIGISGSFTDPTMRKNTSRQPVKFSDETSPILYNSTLSYFLRDQGSFEFYGNGIAFLFVRRGGKV